MSVNQLFLKSGWVSAPLANGVGRYVPQCQRMTLKFCKAKGDSRGVREFIEHGLVDFAKKHKGTVVYLKPRRHRGPVAVAEYLNGHREFLSLHQMGPDEIAKWLETLMCQSGSGTMHYKSNQHSDTPSIQGPWNPFTYQRVELNTMKFPNEKLQVPELDKPSATEIVKKMYRKE